MTVTEQVKGFILENFYVGDAATVQDDTSLIAEGIVDSTGMLELIGFLESRFHIAIADTETIPDNLETIGRIAAFVERKRAAARPPAA